MAQSTDVPHPIDDVEQHFDEGTSYTVREGLQKFIADDLLGPWGGEEEELHHDAGPRDRYLVGMLGPRPAPAHSDETARAAAQGIEAAPEGDGDAREAELPELLTPQASGRIWAPSMGLSFVVPADIGTLSVVAAWGRYARSETLDDEGTVRRPWSREAVRHVEDISVREPEDHEPYYLEGAEGQPHIRLDVRVRRRATTSGPDLRVVEIALVNGLEDSAELRDQNWLFQTRLSVTAFPDDTAPVFLPIDDPLAPAFEHAAPEDHEDRHLRLLYRDELRHAVGRNVAVHAHVRDGQRNAHKLETTWLPTYDVPTTMAPSAKDQELLTGLELSMDALAELAVPGRQDDLAAALRPLADGYAAWLHGQRARAADLPADLRDAAEVALVKAAEIADRVGHGIDTLRADERALEAFRFANRAMALQRRNTAITELRTSSEGTTAPTYEAARTEVEGRGPQAAEWRPFQLAFVLLNLTSLTDPAHPHRGTGREALVDLLFFPTGGGKTEAYLGLAAYTFALRRLQGVIGTGPDARSGDDGVAVLMRYTLRLLTAQQFQRAAALVCAAEHLRREDTTRWGTTPFRIGLWVGGTVSPNWFDEARSQIGMAKESADGRHAGVMQVLNCPWCGEELRAERDVVPDEDRRRILVFCPRGESPADACPFSRIASRAFFGSRAEEEGLPVLTVDEEIYRLVPSMLIATVDKLAQLPWNGYAGLLFGRTTQWCDRHGHRHEDLDTRTGCGSRHNAKGGGKDKGGHDAVRSRPTDRLRPPDLIIQDELHLISGALGTTVGLFEAAVDQLCSWPVTRNDGARLLAGPKIVASTATTKRADEQVRGVFGRAVAVFPPQVLDHKDTFFSRQVPVTEGTPGRRYLGVCAHGTRLKSAEIRLAEILLRAGQDLFDRYGAPADPYMTLVGYFNATRELAGMRRYLDDDVTTRVRRNPSRVGDGIADRIVTRSGMLNVEELTSRISSNQIGTALKRLQGRFDPEKDTSRRRRAIAREIADALSSKPPRRPRVEGGPRAVDAVLATSMLQVGVDVSRFGLMLVVGQPKNTAEYIQASSRVGRSLERPGLVVTLYNWSRPRDLAHYEDFRHYHATFYRQVEALSVTPFTRRALDRGTTPTYVAALRHAVDEHSRNADAQTVDLDGDIARQVEARLLDRAEAVAGSRARGYLSERILALKDEWRERRDGSATLGYRQEKKADEVVTGLLRTADGSRWDPLTVPMSMRETENEINLLLPGGGRYAVAPGPAWDFSATQGHADDEQSTEEQA
ncbi:DISARM system helicase DrmA [Streptomyces sp. DSM 116494]|uniref:DISARM system helicase DrmA n=1 Tax=Streptomyces okerensis TaxID=3344655 RepID=UPI00388FE35C